MNLDWVINDNSSSDKELFLYSEFLSLQIVMDEEMAGFLFMQEAVRCETDAANEELDVHLATTLLIIGADAGQLLCNEQRNIT